MTAARGPLIAPRARRDTLSGMRLVTRVFALVMAFVMCPGGLELLRDVAHLAVAGHVAHETMTAGVLDDVAAAAAPDPHEHGDDSHKDDEHRCSGAFHVCGCHVSPTFVAARAPGDIARAGVSSGARGAIDASSQGARTGVSSSMFRPPIG